MLCCAPESDVAQMKRGFMARTEDEDYDWLNDSFDDSKNVNEQTSMSSNSKKMIGCAVAIFLVVIVVLIGLGIVQFVSLFTL